MCAVPAGSTTTAGESPAPRSTGSERAAEAGAEFRDGTKVAAVGADATVAAPTLPVRRPPVQQGLDDVRR
jgi:hypothetical protein